MLEHTRAGLRVSGGHDHGKWQNRDFPLAAVLRAPTRRCARWPTTATSPASARCPAPAAAAVGRVIARIGHRGLGEAELANGRLPTIRRYC